MRLDVTQKPVDPRDGGAFITSVRRPGKYVKDKDGKLLLVNGQRVLEQEDVELTLRMVIGEALAAVYREESELSAEDKRARARIIEKAFDNDFVDLSDEEVSMVRERIDRAYGPLTISAVDKIFKSLGVKVEGKKSDKAKK
jgi:hypothetical protein